MKTKAKLRQSYLESQKLTDVRIMLKVADAFNAGYEAAMGQLQPQLFHKGPDVYIIDANNLLPKPMPLTIAELDQLADADKVMNSSNNLNGWISVNDSLPEPKVPVLVLFKNRITLAAIEDREDEFTESGTFRVWKALKLQQDDIYECYPWKAITHWMPLPKLPEEK